jgi:hypothetical protein
MRDKAWLQRMVIGLHGENRASLRQIPEPVGRTVRQVQIGDACYGIVINEPLRRYCDRPMN